MEDEPETTPGGEPARPRGARVKRRWAIFGKAGGGVAVIAVAGAIAAGAPDTSSGAGDTASGGDSQEQIVDSS